MVEQLIIPHGLGMPYFTQTLVQLAKDRKTRKCEHHYSLENLIARILPEHHEYIATQDTYIVGWFPDMGWVYQQTFIHIASGTAITKLYPYKNPLAAAEILNDRVLAWLLENGIPLIQITTDRGSEYCGNVKRHPYQLYLPAENIRHVSTTHSSPQHNRVCTAFHQAMSEEFYQTVLHENRYYSLEQLQYEVDEWVEYYNSI
jgi:transposase InsO family protein